MILEGQQQHDCEPTLTDAEVVDFCRSEPPPLPFLPWVVGPSPDAAEGSGGRDGYIKFDAVVPDAISERCCAFLDDHPSGEPSELFQEECAPRSCRPILLFTAVAQVVCGRSAAVPGGGGRGPLAAGPRLWAADSDLQPPRPVSRAPAGLASCVNPGRACACCACSRPRRLIPSTHCLGRVCGPGRRFALRAPGRDPAGDVLPTGHAGRERTDVRPAAPLPASGLSILENGDSHWKAARRPVTLLPAFSSGL